MAALPQPPMPVMPHYMVPQMERPAAAGAERAWSDYEAMRRQAMEEARQRWEQAYRMRPAPPVPYYGYPGYYRAPTPAPVQQSRD